MAYGLKYRFEWQSPMREKSLYEVVIYEEGYTGAVRPLYPSGEKIVVTQGSIDDNELVPIKPTEITLTLLCKEYNEPYASFYTLDPKKYRIFVTECTDMCIPKWEGYIATGDYSQPYAKPPYQVVVRANDGFGILKAMPYLDANDELFARDLTIRELLEFLLSPLDEEGMLRYVDIWDYEKVSPTQDGHTFDLISISDSTIYNVFEETPSYYDVLERVLSNFGLQLFQLNGKWCIRSLGALVRSASLGNIPIHLLNSGERGISASSILSFVPPVGKLTIEATDSSQVALKDMLEPKWWAAEHDKSTGHSFKAMVVRKRHGRLFLQFGGLGTTAWYMLPGTVSYSASTRLKFRAKLYNGVNIDQNVRIGVWLVDARYRGSDYMEVYRQGDFGDRYVETHTPILASNPTTLGWTNVQGGKWKDVFDDTTTTLFTIPKNSRVVGNGASQDSYTEFGVEVTTDGIPVYNQEVKEWRVIVVFCQPEFKYFHCWLDEPTIEVFNDSAISSEASNDILIAGEAVEDVAYTPTFNSVKRLNVSNEVFAPTIHYTGTERPVYGCVTPASGMSFADVIGANLKLFRENVSRQLEGDLYHLEDNGLNSLFQDYDRRAYYVNYSRWLYSRGVREVQLRQICSIGGVIQNALPAEYGIINGTWSVDGVIFFTSSGQSWLMRYEPTRNKYSAIVELDGTETIAVGVNALCVIKASVSKSVRNVTMTAYDKLGKVISRLENIETGLNTDSIWLDAMHSARYDILNRVWVYFVRNSANEVINVIDDSGYALLSTSVALRSTDTVLSPHLFAGGYVVPVLTGGRYYSFWLSYSIHTGAKVETAVQGSLYIVAVNDIMVVAQSATGQLYVYERTSPTLDINLATPLFITDEDCSVVAMNCAILLYAKAGDRAYAFDLRTLTNRSVGYATALGFALCGSTAYTFGERNKRAIYGYTL